MNNTPVWLPKLIELSGYKGDFIGYIEAVYNYFKADFVDSSPVFQGTPFKLKRHPIEQNKEATFWHLTTTGKDEANREHDLRRCERIRWPRAIIDHAEQTLSIKIWEEKVKGDTRVLLWFENIDYLVVLSKRTGYYLLWTAYPLDYKHNRRKLNTRYEKYGKK